MLSINTQSPTQKQTQVMTLGLLLVPALLLYPHMHRTRSHTGSTTNAANASNTANTANAAAASSSTHRAEADLAQQAGRQARQALAATTLFAPMCCARCGCRLLQQCLLLRGSRHVGTQKENTTQRGDMSRCDAHCYRVETATACVLLAGLAGDQKEKGGEV